MWMGDSESADSITMSQVELPSVLILDPQTQFYYLATFKMADMTQDDLINYLHEVIEGKSQVSNHQGSSSADLFSP